MINVRASMSSVFINKLLSRVYIMQNFIVHNLNLMQTCTIFVTFQVFPLLKNYDETLLQSVSPHLFDQSEHLTRRLDGLSWVHHTPIGLPFQNKVEWLIFAATQPVVHFLQ